MSSRNNVVRIVTLHPFDSEEIETIKAAAPKVEIEFAVCLTREEFNEKAKEAEVVYGDIRGEVLRSATKLKWVQAGGAGIEGIDPALLQGSVVVTNFARTFAPAISETAIGMLLCLTRGISKYY